MKAFEEMQHHPMSEKLVSVLCEQTENTDPTFFRILVAYYFSLVASMMRAKIMTQDRGEIPINLYAINLATSGAGKGHSTNLMEERVIHLFRDRFKDETFQLLAEASLPKIALKRANRKCVDPDEELARVQKEFDKSGPLLFTFSDATVPAVKEMRHKLLMADAGSLNFQMDEVGSYLSSAAEVLVAFLELYDMGTIKPKLIKNTTDNARSEEIIGKTPTNMMLFGTPSKLLDGGKTEQEFYDMLETGYARRCFFGFTKGVAKDLSRTAEEVFDQLTKSNNTLAFDQVANHLESLADMVNVRKGMVMTKETSLILIEYKIRCEKEAATYPEHDEVKKAEISHRYFKALKLAGAYAFVDDSIDVNASHLYAGIKMAEESGMAFHRLLTRDKPYVKLAKFIAAVKREVTQSDLVEELPFYRGPASNKADMLTLAVAWGYKNNIIIKKTFTDSIEFFRGETLKETDLSSMVIAYSDNMTENYRNERAKFEDLHKLTQAQGMHWVNHHLNGGYRNEENAITGFSFVVIDVDGSVQLTTAKLLMKKYKALYYTTKRHTDETNRFRIMLPINYELQLDAKEYKEFYKNLCEWLPFDADLQCGHRSKKWLSNDHHYEYTEGEILDALPFIPKTSKNEERKLLLNSQQSMDNLERWVINNIGDGNRNNMLLRYAMLLLDGGFDFEAIRVRVIGLNNKLMDKLDESEVMATIMITVAKNLSKR
jgi:hypothetical protein